MVKILPGLAYFLLPSSLRGPRYLNTGKCMPLPLGTATLVLRSRHTRPLPCWAGTLSTSSVLISVSMHVVGKPVSQRAQHPESASRPGLSINAWPTPLTGLEHLMAGPLPWAGFPAASSLGSAGPGLKSPPNASSGCWRPRPRGGCSSSMKQHRDKGS